MSLRLRPSLAALLALLAVHLLLPSVAMAQILPPARVTGFIDNLTTWDRNMTDLRFTDRRDNEWFARTRGRFDLSVEIGRARGVLGLEIDATYGLTGFQDNATNNQIEIRDRPDSSDTEMDRRSRDRRFGATGQLFGTTGAFDLNTDVVAGLEVKWLYVEFPLPLVPLDMLVRVGAQPFATTFKVGTLATGDYAGLNLVTSITPFVRWHLTYASVDERLSGAHLGNPLDPSDRLSKENLNFFNGDDYAFITSVEWTPVRGLDLRPTYAYFHAEGTTSVPARVQVGQISPIVNGETSAATPSFCLPARECDGFNNHSAKENRHTIGLDARWTLGAFSLRPTVFYQFGSREQVNPFANTLEKADISAFLLDVISGYRVGPLLLELRGTYTTGNRPKDQLFKTVKYYQPIDTDTTFGADGWGNIFALGIDYLTGAIGTLGTGIGWDRYGRGQVGLKAIYSVTAALEVYALAQGLWTARQVDIDEEIVPVALPQSNTRAFGSVLVPSLAGGSNGDASLIGTEINAGVTWRFAPGLTLDLVYAHLFSGPALDLRQNLPDGTSVLRKSRDADMLVARVRFAF